MIARRPVMKAIIPAAIPASIESARAGLAAISAKIVLPAGIDAYNEFVNDAPAINRIGIAMISPTDHLPNEVIGIIFQVFFMIRISAHKVHYITMKSTPLSI